MKVTNVPYGWGIKSEDIDISNYNFNSIIVRPRVSYVLPIAELDQKNGNSLVPTSKPSSPKSNEDLLLGNIIVLLLSFFLSLILFVYALKYSFCNYLGSLYDIPTLSLLPFLSSYYRTRSTLNDIRYFALGQCHKILKQSLFYPAKSCC